MAPFLYSKSPRPTWRDHQANNRHHVDEDVHRWARGILEGVAYGVADNCCGMDIRSFATQIAFLACF